MVSVRKLLRGAASCVLFGAFGLGSLVLSPLILLLGTTERRQPVVRFVWGVLVWLFIRLGLIRLDRGELPNCRGTILVANHPSLIDVVLLSVLVPRLLCVAKRAVGTNPFMGVVARSVILPVGAENLGQVADCLAAGWNVLVFPEGTRSPRGGSDAEPALHRFRRGAAQLALRTGAPIVCVGIRQSRRILAKFQPAWDVGADPVRYAIRADEATMERPQPGESQHAAACRVTAELERRVKELLA